jgi:hypothetical protein
MGSLQEYRVPLLLGQDETLLSHLIGACQFGALEIQYP